MLCAGGAHAAAARPAPRRASRQRLCTRATATAPAPSGVAVAAGKPRVVVLGSGWGAISFVRAVEAASARPSGTRLSPWNSPPSPRRRPRT